MARSPERGMTVCTEPLPNEVRPMSFARWLSLRAPATISAAEAEPPLINTTIGAPLSASPGVEKSIGHRHRRLEHAARIVAQVEHQPLERRAIALAQVLERGGQIIAGG